MKKILCGLITVFSFTILMSVAGADISEARARTKQGIDIDIKVDVSSLGTKRI